VKWLAVSGRRYRDRRDSRRSHAISPARAGHLDRRIRSSRRTTLGGAAENTVGGFGADRQSQSRFAE